MMMVDDNDNKPTLVAFFSLPAAVLLVVALPDCRILLISFAELAN